MDRLKEIFMCLFMFSIYLFSFKEGLNVISNMLGIAFVLLVVLDVFFHKQKFRMDMFFGFFLGFLLFCTFSYFYAKSQEESLKSILTLAQIFIFCLALFNYLDNMDKIKRALIYFIVAGVSASIYLMFSGEEYQNASRIGSAIGNENMVGIILTISYGIGLHFALLEKKWYYILSTLFMFYFILLTGSRTAFLIATLVTTVYIYLNYIKTMAGILKILIITPVVFAVIINIIMNDPFLYTVIGSRLQNIFLYFTGQELLNSEQSISTRKAFSDIGMLLFSQHPFTGVGINNFRIYLYANIGINTYAHNDFAELLADVGLFGTIAYYGMYFTNIARLWGKNQMGVLFISIIFAIGIVSFFAGVMYYSKHLYVIMTLCVSYLYAYKNENVGEASFAKLVE